MSFDRSSFYHPGATTAPGTREPVSQVTDRGHRCAFDAEAEPKVEAAPAKPDGPLYDEGLLNTVRRTGAIMCPVKGCMHGPNHGVFKGSTLNGIRMHIRHKHADVDEPDMMRRLEEAVLAFNKGQVAGSGQVSGDQLVR